MKGASQCAPIAANIKPSYTNLIPPESLLLPSPALPLPKSRSNRIPNNQLLPLLKTRPQIPHTLIQSRGKNVTDIAKHALMLLHTQSLAQETDDGGEGLVGAEFEDALG
jgi:hypothetical protein